MPPVPPVRLASLVDLTHPLGPGTDVYPGDPEVRLRPHATIARDGFNLLAVRMGSQSGTHIDAPFHFSTEGARVDELPLELFAGPAVLVDATAVGARGRIGFGELEPAAERIREGVIVLLRTGWSSRYGSPAYAEHPFLDPGACAWLLARGVRTVGIDAPSIDETSIDETNIVETNAAGDDYPCHRLIAAAGGVICENLTNLEAVTFDDLFVSLLPLPLEGADGAPVRAIAFRIESPSPQR